MMSILKTGYENGKRVQRVNQFGKAGALSHFWIKNIDCRKNPKSFTGKRGSR